MFEKLGLPAKPSIRGGSWVLDASHCQGCSSQFSSLFNRKHHCQRCGGLFCNACTQQRMVLRGQGDAPVRICEPCKKIEEATRFELRHGHRKSSKAAAKSPMEEEEEALYQILGTDDKKTSVSQVMSRGVAYSSVGGVQNSASSSNRSIDSGVTSTEEALVDSIAHVGSIISPEELQQQAAEEKIRYRTLKAEGKNDEALKAFKHSRELERQAGALEILLRKNRRLALKSSHKSSSINSPKDDGIVVPESKVESGSKKVKKDKNDLISELRDLGWSDTEIHGADSKAAHMSLEGELSQIIGEVAQQSSENQKIGRIDRSLVNAQKKKALMLKREGKLAEAKEELRAAKILERQLEEQEILGESEESDDEFAALVRSINDNNSNGDILLDNTRYPNIDFEKLLRDAEGLAADGHFDVTDDDLNNPELEADLIQFGWREEDEKDLEIDKLMSSNDHKALQDQVKALKREAVMQKKAGNISEATALLKKAKLLEKDMAAANGLQAEAPLPEIIQPGSNMVLGTALAEAPQKSKLTVQKELMASKKRLLALRREGKLSEAEEELRRGEVLEKQLEELASQAKRPVAEVQRASMEQISTYEVNVPILDLGDHEIAAEVTEQDLTDPILLGGLKSLGWNDDNEDAIRMKEAVVEVKSKSKLVMQKELLASKKRALALRREGKVEESEEELNRGKILEKQLEELESRSKHTVAVKSTPAKMGQPRFDREDETLEADIREQDIQDPTLLSDLHNLGWNDPASASTNRGTSSLHTEVIRKTMRKRGDIQRELLAIKRKALALTREGKTEEAEEVLQKAKYLEEELADIESATLSIPRKEDSPKIPQDKSDLNITTTAEQFVNAGPVQPAKNASSLNELFSSRHRENLGDISGDTVGIPSLMQFEGRISRADNWFDDLTGDVSLPEIRVLEKESSPIEPSVFPIVAQSTNEIVAAASDMKSSTAPDEHSEYRGGSIKDEILIYKRKAVALKREGKLAEAREALKHAKLLEKSQVDGQQTVGDAEMPPLPIVEQESKMSKPVKVSSKDRLRIQRESLSHKRNAMKLRREGKIAEAEAEYELAKELESQLGDLDSKEPSSEGVDASDDAIVEDLLDPELMATLKSLGLGDANLLVQPVQKPGSKSRIDDGKGSSVATQSPKRSAAPLLESSGPLRKVEAKPRIDERSSSSSPSERARMEEQIKAERQRALHLKRDGKQAEAIEALRSAKLLEKKLSTLDP